MKFTRIKQVSAIVLSSMLLSCSLIDGIDTIGINKCEAIVRKVVVRKPVIRKPSNTTNPQQSNQSSINDSDNITANRPTVVINNDSKFDTKSDKGNTNSGLQVEKNNINTNLVLGSNNGNEEQLGFARGDVNGDGQVTITDLSILKRYLAGNPSGSSKFIEKNADLNGDGNITMTDLSQLQQLIMGGGNNNQNSNTDNGRQATMSPVMLNEGLYSLQPACAPRMELTVEGASKEAGANVFLYSINSPNQTAPSHQKWRITHLRDYWYKIEAENSNYALNIHNGYSVNGTNVSVWPYGGRMHEFMFYNAGNGYYYIQGNVPGAFMLDVSGGGNANGTNVQIYEYNASLAQRWKLVRVNAANDVHPESIAQRYVDVFSDSGLKNKYVGRWIGKGERYRVIQDNGISLKVEYYSDSGQVREGFVSKNIKEEVVQGNIDGKFNELRAVYPDGSTNNGYYYYNGVYQGKQCYGFALTLGEYLSGQNPKNWSKQNSLAGLQPGDIVVCNRPHTFMITSISGDNIQFVDCNATKSDTVAWDRGAGKTLQQWVSHYGGLNYVYKYPG